MSASTLPSYAAAPDPFPTLVTGREAAAMLGVQPRTIRKWSGEGKLTKYAVGGTAIRFDVAELRSLVRVKPLAAGRVA